MVRPAALLALALDAATIAVSVSGPYYGAEPWDDDGRHAPCGGPCPLTLGPVAADEAPAAGRSLSSSAGQGRVLFVVVTDSNFYASRVQWVLQTWASSLPERDLVVIGDAPYNQSAAFNSSVKSTNCPAHTHESGCCKWGMAVEHIYKKMAAEPDIDWAYVADDDTYVRTDMVRRMVDAHSDPDDTGVVLAVLGCGPVKEPCAGGICGGGGFAVNRMAVYKAAGFKLREVEPQEVALCHQCGEWADLAIWKFFLGHGVEMRNQANLYPFKLNKIGFQRSLPAGPIMYHYVKTEGQMWFLHKLFTTSLPSLPPSARTQCVQHRGARRCIEVANAGDVPWST